MSEEFLRVAKKEVTDDIAKIGILLQGCSNDSDISKNATEIKARIHNLKGLAPMMGQTEIGDVATTVDNLLKLTISGKSVPDIFEAIKKSHQFMLDAINGVKSNFDSLKNDLDERYSVFF